MKKKLNQGEGMRKYTVLAAVLLVTGIVTLSPAQTWTVEQVTDNTEPDKYPFVNAVSSGLMIVYMHNDGDDEVFYANNFSGSWNTSRITDNSRPDGGLDIASNYNEEIAHISIIWLETPDAEISYCTGSPGSWNTERVTDDAEVDAWPTLAIDKQGYIHMAFYKAVPGDREIFYTNNTTGDWEFEQVTDNATEDSYPWIALDSDDNPHIVYADATHLWYTEKTTGIWSTPEMITDGVGASSYPFLALDAEDNCHVSYGKHDGADFEIYYANNVTAGWPEAKVTTNDYDDMNPTLILDPNRDVHIAFMGGEPDKEIYYANNTSGIWTSSRITDNSIDDNVKMGRFFAVCAGRIGHVFFWNNSDGDNEIYHAYSNSPLFEAVEETAPVTTPLSIKLDRGISGSTVHYSIPHAGHVSLKVYDASGSLIKTLVNSYRPEGNHTVIWNGETDDGVHAAPGVCFYHLVAGGQKTSAKAVLK
ncbi:hypothetical protein GF359_10635 [candidate division WOR-3 bacterium]|uniref:FlgD/Vpr Ig-like domain-containing protein n=1 Tax=candidate division WOR-3 bacterium TaxID=2052148 RepID=A0A9D5KBH0_UNCW3|nr:hypothetical protein [candidate division WOR-3 bacterium]MBD3365657.1 hypothetical protein [candidate division WOR-3 bacterium]